MTWFEVVKVDQYIQLVSKTNRASLLCYVLWPVCQKCTPARELAWMVHPWWMKKAVLMLQNYQFIGFWSFQPNFTSILANGTGSGVILSCQLYSLNK